MYCIEIFFKKFNKIQFSIKINTGVVPNCNNNNNNDRAFMSKLT